MTTLVKTLERNGKTYVLKIGNVGKSRATEHAKPDKQALVLELLKQNTELSQRFHELSEAIMAILLRNQQTLSMLQGELKEDQ